MFENSSVLHETKCFRMTQKFTQNDLIRFAYEELDSFTEAELAVNMRSNPELKAEYTAIEEMRSKLNELHYQPSESSLQIILEHSRKKEDQLEGSPY